MKKRIAAAAAALVVAAALPVVAKWEGLELKPYYDIVNVKTVCYGETRGVEDRIYTKAECDVMLAGGLEEFYTKIDPCMPDDVPPKAAGMFLSFSWNVGPGAFCKSQTIQSAFTRKDYAAACRGMNLFNKAGGKVVNGLVKRRAEESKLCLAGLK
jgi:lysozyme